VFVVDDAILIFVVTAVSTIAIEVSAEIVAEWLIQRYYALGIDPSSAPMEQWAESGCLPPPDVMFANLVGTVSSGVDCAAMTAIDCFEACPVVLRLVVY
jgi:hypothetical protein